MFFADEMVDLRLVAPPPGVELFPLPLTPLQRRTDIADGRVEPDVPVVAGAIGDLEAKVGCRTGDIPIVERLAQEMPSKIVGHLGLEGAGGLSPLLQKTVQLFIVDEQVLGAAQLGRGPRECALRVDQVRGAIGMTALLTTVAVLVRLLAIRAGPSDEPIGQEGPGDGIVKLPDLLLQHQPRLAQGGPDLVADLPRFLTVGAAVVVENDVESGEVVQVGLVHPGDQILLRDSLPPGTDHDRRAMGVVGAHIDATVPPQPLETDPDISLDVLDQMAQMDGTVGIGKCAGDKDASDSHSGIVVVG